MQNTHGTQRSIGINFNERASTDFLRELKIRFFTADRYNKTDRQTFGGEEDLPEVYRLLFLFFYETFINECQPSNHHRIKTKKIENVRRILHQSFSSSLVQRHHLLHTVPDNTCIPAPTYLPYTF